MIIKEHITGAVVVPVRHELWLGMVADKTDKELIDWCNNTFGYTNWYCYRSGMQFIFIFQTMDMQPITIFRLKYGF